jgi:hypothetical protein
MVRCQSEIAKRKGIVIGGGLIFLLFIISMFMQTRK